MFRAFTAIILLASIIAISGCCLSVDCGYDDGTLKLRLMRDGKNALYGPDAFLTQDDIKLFYDGSFEEFIEFDTTLQAIQIYVFSNPHTILEIKNISTDTLSFTSEKLSNKGCCDEYQTTAVLRNGEMICEGVCDGVIEVEI